MATPKISMFIISLIWVGFFAAIAAPFIANVGSNYGVQFNESQISVLNKLDQLNEDVKEYKDTTFEYKEKTGITDILGDFFSAGFKSLKIMASSLDIFKEMLFNSFNNSVYNIPAMQSLKTSIFLTVMVLIIIGVIVKALIKSDV